MEDEEKFSKVRAKIFYENETKETFVIIQDFLNFPNFEKIKEIIYEAAKRKDNKASGRVIDEDEDEVKLVFRKTNEDCPDLKEIFDFKTYDYFRNKLKRNFKKEIDKYEKFRKSNNLASFSEVQTNDECNIRTAIMITPNKVRQFEQVNESIDDGSLRSEGPKIRYDGKHNYSINFRLEIVKDGLPEWNPQPYQGHFTNFLETKLKEFESNINDRCNSLNLVTAENKYNNISNNNYQVNQSIICNGCLKKNFKGIRYICSGCRNQFNLCEECEKQSSHCKETNHLLMLMNPISADAERHYQTFDNLISPKSINIKKSEEDCLISIRIWNKSKNKTTLNGCYISPIRFGEQYLDCVIEEISSNGEFGTYFDYEIILSNLLEDGVNEGFLRMFTKDGLPFGEIIHIRVI